MNVHKLTKADKVAAEMKGEIAMKKISKGYDRLKNLGHWGHKAGATRPAGMAKLVKTTVKTTKPKKG